MSSLPNGGQRRAAASSGQVITTITNGTLGAYEFFLRDCYSCAAIAGADVTVLEIDFIDFWALVVAHRLEADYQSSWTPIQEQVDFVFSMIFVVEAFLKIVGMGFVLHPRAYLRDYWNWLDFFIVIVSLVGLVPGINSDSLKSLRTFRILRPLRSINSMPRMRNLIQSLLASIPGLLNTIAFLAFIFAIFAIFGTNQFLGKQYQFCRSTEEVVFPEDGSPAFWPKLEDEGSPALCATDA